MTFLPNDIVVIQVGTEFKEGKLIESIESNYKTYWWVQYQDNVDLITLEDLTLWNRIKECVCGAKKAYEPAEPPGHANYCV